MGGSSTETQSLNQEQATVAYTLPLNRKRPCLTGQISTLNAKITCKNSVIASVVHPHVRQRCSCLHSKTTCPSTIGTFQTMGQKSFLSGEKPQPRHLCTLKASSLCSRGFTRRCSAGISEARDLETLLRARVKPTRLSL